MSKVIILLALFMNSIFVIAQEVDAIKDNAGNNQFVLDFTYDTWLDAPNNMKMKWNSFGFNFYLMNHVPFGESNFGLGVGVGVGVSNIKNNMAVGKDTNEITTFTELTTEYEKNKIATTYFDIPVELRFRSQANGQGKGFHVGLGFKAGYLINNHTKYKGKDLTGLTNEDMKIKVFDLPNINEWRYGPTFRIGYGKVNLVAYYALSSPFLNGEAEASRQLSAGLTMTLP